MAYVYLLSVSLFTALASYVILSDEEGMHRLSLRAALLIPVRLWAIVQRVATSRLVPVALDIDAVAALCDTLTLRARPVMPDVVREELCAALQFAEAALCCVLTVVVRSFVAIPVALGASILAVVLWDGSRRRRLERELVSAMPGVFRTLSMALGSGETLAQAVDYVGEHDEGPAGQAFHRASLRLRCGESVAEALEQLTAELDAPGVSLLATALAISQRTGSPLRSLFRHAAELVERQGSFERTLNVKTAQVRLSVRIVSLLPLVLVSTLSLISPDFRAGLLSATGMTCVLVAACMDGVGLIIIRRLMRGVL